MPPRARITKDMIVEAGLKVVRSEGEENLNVRKVAAELNCSTQPVMYHYATVDELREDVYSAADELHTRYIMTPYKNAPHPMLSIGMRYICFADEEKHLFRFLFQSGKFRNTSLRQLMGSEESKLFIKPLREHTGLPEDRAKEAFETLFICVHGAASLIANNDMILDEEQCERMLTNCFKGIVEVMKGVQNEKTI